MADPQGFAPNSPFAQAVKNMGMDRPEVPAEAYDSWRQSYFNKRIAPRLHPDQRQKQRDAFMERTKRPDVSTMKHINALVNVAAQETEAVFEKPFGMLPGPIGRSARAQSAKDQAAVDKEREALRWHGKAGGGVAEFYGGVGGYTVLMGPAERLVGAVGGTLKKALPLLNFVRPGVKGAALRSVAFGLIQGASADPGQHTSEFTKGVGWGVGGEVAGATLGGLWRYYKGRKQLPSPKEVDEFIKQMARGETADTQAAKDMDAALAEDISARQKNPGQLDKLQVVLNEKVSNPIATFVDANGNKFESRINLQKPEQAYASIKEAVAGGRTLAKLEHDEFDGQAVNDLLAKLKQDYEPWSTTPTQVATNAASKGIDAGGGTARVDNKVLKYRYAKEAPSREDARRFIKSAVGEDSRKVGDLMDEFDSVWNPYANWMARTDAAKKLEALGLSDLIPTPDVVAKWKPSEGMNLPKIFNEKGWYETLDRYTRRAEDGTTRGLDLREKEHLTSSMKVLWDPSVPSTSPMFQSALRTMTQYELKEFLPGQLSREEVASLLNQTRAGSETQAKAAQRVELARKEPQEGIKETYYQRVGRLSEILAKEKDPDLKHYTELYGTQVVEAATNMAALMWERSKGDLLQVKWDQDLLKQGIEEGFLLSSDASIEASEIDSIRRATLDSKVLRLAEQYNVDPRNIDRELLEEVGEAEVARAKEVADAAKKRGVSVYDASVNEEARRLGILEDNAAFAPRGVPSSELPSREPGEPSGLPVRSVRFPDGTVGKFSYSVRRAASGLPSRIYLMFNDAVTKRLAWGGAHSTGASLAAGLSRDKLGAVANDLKAIADMNGIDLQKALVTMIHRPDAGFQKGLVTANIWHEDLHGMLSQLSFVEAVKSGRGLRTAVGTVNQTFAEVYGKLSPAMQKTWDAFGAALKERYGPLYDKMALPEEGFVHAATAIRHNDVGTIAHFGAVDTDVEHVFDAVQAIAGQLKKTAAEMAPGASKNFLMDRLGFLENISQPDRYKAVRQAAEEAFSSVGGDVDTLLSKANQSRFKDWSKLFSSAEENLEGRAFAPNYTSWAEAAGARHAMYPTQMPPGRGGLPMPERGLEEKDLHFIPVAQAWEKVSPMMSWVNWADKKFNQGFGKKGEYFPLADRVRAVIETRRAGEAWLDTNRKSAVEFLAGGAKKLETYGYMMTRPLREWGGLAQKMQLTNDDLMRLKQAREWLTNFEADTGVRVMNYFQELQPKLASHNYDLGRVFPEPAKGSSMSTFHRMLSSGELNAKDLHLGRNIQVFLREGMEKKFTGESLKNLNELLNKKDKETGKYLLGDLRRPLQSFHDYMRGMPDSTGKMLKGFGKSFQALTDKGIQDINKHLPQGFQIPKIEWPENVVHKMLLMSYISNIGGRVSLGIRDGMQGPMLGIPIIGPKAFFKGLSMMTDTKMRLFAEQAGVPLKAKNVVELFGDIFEETKPSRFDKALDVAGMLMAPSRWGHNFARETIFLGSFDRALPLVKSFRGDASASAEKFFKDTGLWFADEARQKQLLSLVKDKYVDPKEAAKQIALEMNDLTQWAYRRGAQPGLLRTTPGRIFGQYMYWPANYADYIRRLVSKIPQYPKEALSALGLIAVTSYGLQSAARDHLGVDISKWFGVSPAGYAGNPHLEFIQDLAKAPEETNPGRAARKRVLEYGLDFVPAWNEVRTMKEVWDKPMLEDSGELTPDAWKALGFRISEPGEPTFEEVVSGDITLERYLKYEGGFKK